MRNKLALASLALISALSFARPALAEPTQTKPQTLFLFSRSVELRSPALDETPISSRWHSGSCELAGKTLTITRKGDEEPITVKLDMPIRGSTEHRKNGALALFCSEEQVAVIYPSVAEFYGLPTGLVSEGSALTSFSFGRTAVGATFICDGKSAVIVFDDSSYRILKFTPNDGVHGLASLHETIGQTISNVLFGGTGDTVYMLLPETGMFFAIFNSCSVGLEVRRGTLPKDSTGVDCSSDSCIVQGKDGKQYALPTSAQ